MTELLIRIFIGKNLENDPFGRNIGGGGRA